jgi:hypothetical protein
MVSFHYEKIGRAKEDSVLRLKIVAKFETDRAFS